MRAAPLLLPGMGLRIEAVEIDEYGLTVLVTTRRARAPCPVCGRPAGRVHSRYARTLGDLPWSGARVSLSRSARRLPAAKAVAS
jgi:transposase